jgi:hypothetical protein
MLISRWIFKIGCQHLGDVLSLKSWTFWHWFRHPLQKPSVSSRFWELYHFRKFLSFLKFLIYCRALLPLWPHSCTSAEVALFVGAQDALPHSAQSALAQIWLQLHTCNWTQWQPAGRVHFCCKCRSSPPGALWILVRSAPLHLARKCMAVHLNTIVQ